MDYSAQQNGSDNSQEARRRLLRTFPDLEVVSSGSDIVDALVLGAICELAGERGAAALLEVGDVIRILRQDAGLEYQKAEIFSALERLERCGDIYFRDKEHRAFIVAEERYVKVVAQRQHRDLTELRLRESWIAAVEQRHALSSEDAARLWAVLEQFVTTLVESRAEEAASFLYAGSEMGQVRFYSLIQAKRPVVENAIPPELGDIARQEVLRFFDPSNPTCVEFLSDRLFASFYFSLLTIDPSASALALSNISERVLYLDTNVLCRLLGLHGPTLAFGPATAVDLAQKLKCELRVTAETVNEFVRSLRSETHKLRGIPLSRDTYRRIAAEHASDDLEFMQAFYREWNSGRVNSVDEFERKYSNVRAFHEGWTITIEDDAELTDLERDDPQFADQFSALNSWHNQENPPESIEHDVFLWRCIERLRERGAHTPAGTRHWLLTYDRRLTAFAVHKAAHDRLPFSLVVDDWLQIARPFLPRTADHARSFVALLAHPLLVQELRRRVPFEHVVGALNRLERYEELPSNVVASMVADGEFVRRLRATSDEREARKLI